MLLGYPEDVIHVIPHPVDDAFSISHESDFTEPYKLLYIGSLSKHKGVDKLIPILASLRDAPEAFTLTIVGTGGLTSDIETQITEKRLSDLVDLRGFVPNEELSSIYAAHDCFVYPGIWKEPLARVYLEALSSGTPIVTTEYGSIENIIGEAGQLTDGTVDDFIAVLLNMIRSNQLELISEATQSEVTEFMLDTVVSDIESIYQRLVWT